MTRTTVLLAPLLALLGVVGPAAAESVAPDLEAALHLKILTYDRNLKSRGNRLVIGVIYKAGAEPSEKSRSAMVSAFQALAKKVTVQGLKPSVVAVAFEAGTLAKRLQDAGVNVIYVAAGLDEALGGIAETAAQLKVPTLTARRGDVERGLAVGVVAADGKPRIVVNLAAAKAAGMDLDPKLLGLAEVLR